MLGGGAIFLIYAPIFERLSFFIEGVEGL